jgi:hypothetical protein
MRWLWGALAAVALCATSWLLGSAAAQGTAGEAQWSDSAIRASRREMPAPAGSPTRSQPAADVLAVADGDSGQVTVVNASNLALLHQFAARQPVLGQPRLTADDRYALVLSQNGWLTQYDLWSGATPVAEVRAGLVARDFAVSADGRWILVGNASPHSLALFDARLNLVRSYPARTLDGSASSPVGSVHDAPARKSFVVAFETMAQLWELSYDPKAEPIFDGLVHDYRMGEAIATAGFLGARRVPLEQPIAVVGFDSAQRHVLATRRENAGAAHDAGGAVDVINLDVRRRLNTLDFQPASSAQAATSLTQRGRPLLAVVTQAGSVAIIDPAGWRVIANVPAPAGPIFVVTHPQVPHLWIGSSSPGATGSQLTLVDKETLQVTNTIEVAGGALQRADFNRDGSRAIVVVGGKPGTFVAYDTRARVQAGRVQLANGTGSLQCPGERCPHSPRPPADPGTSR